MFKSASGKIRKLFEQPVNKAIDTVAGVFASADQLSPEDMALLAMVKAVLPVDPDKMEKALGRIRSRLEKQSYSDRKINNFLEFLRKVAPGTPEKTAEVLSGCNEETQEQFIENLLALALDDGEYRADALEATCKLAQLIGYTEEKIESLVEKIKIASNNHSKILRSGTGIILALIVIGIFILTATWLSSLLFGIVLAYIFLPLEQYLERRLRRPPGKLKLFFKMLNPVEKIRVRLRTKKFELSEAEQKRRERQALTTKAVTLTVSFVVFSALILVLGGGLLLGNYVRSLNSRTEKASVPAVQTADKKINGSVPVSSTGDAAVKTAAVQTSQMQKSGKTQNTKSVFGLSAAGGSNSADYKKADISLAKAENNATLSRKFSNKLIDVLEDQKVRFQKLPLIQGIITELSIYLADDKAEQQITELLLKKSGGLLEFLTDFATMFASFLLNILMTFFFFSLILSKLASFVGSKKDNEENNGQNVEATSYLIRTVFNGKWLPQMSEENLREGDRIVGEVFSKLRIWLRGYMTMIIIDFCVYSLVFYFLDVPYALILGGIAALGILLPYIGPISSALLTVLVTLAVGGADASVMQIIGIVGIYLLHNGIIEQFFIYPMIIGESLGLSTLETIIVVLLGGILAGIPGMIFALPTASVIKYLVPQIYRCWR